MKFGDWLDVTDVGGMYFVIYCNDSEKPFWQGSYMDIPFWIAKYNLPTSYSFSPIDYRSDLGKECDNKPGFVVILEDKE